MVVYASKEPHELGAWHSMFGVKLWPGRGEDTASKDAQTAKPVCPGVFQTPRRWSIWNTETCVYGHLHHHTQRGNLEIWQSVLLLSMIIHDHTAMEKSLASRSIIDQCISLFPI